MNDFISSNDDASLPKLSVILVSKNAEALILGALESIVGQNYQKVELIVIDGKSTDRTVEIITTFKDRITYFESEPDNGLYFAMNRGLKFATGDLIGFIGCDDRYSKNAFDLIAAKYDRNKFQVIYGSLKYTDRSLENQVLSVPPSRFPKTMIPHPTCFITRRAIELCNGFDTSFRIAADLDLVIRATRHGAILQRIPTVLVETTSNGFSARKINKYYSIFDEFVIRSCYRIQPRFLVVVRSVLMLFLITCQNIYSLMHARFKNQHLRH